MSFKRHWWIGFPLAILTIMFKLLFISAWFSNKQLGCVGGKGLQWKSFRMHYKLSVMSKQKLAMTRKAGLSPANNLPLITYKRGTSQQTMCVLKKILERGGKVYHTGHSSSLNRPRRDSSSSWPCHPLCSFPLGPENVDRKMFEGPLVEIFSFFLHWQDAKSIFTSH